jgi:DNA (cytosine-5)-methyltransferase 1
MGSKGKRTRVLVSEYPTHEPYEHLLEVINVDMAVPISHRAAAGFLQRLEKGNLGRYPGFREDMAEHVRLSAPPRVQAIA